MSTVPTPIVLDGYMEIIAKAGFNTYRTLPGMSGKKRTRAVLMAKTRLIESRSGQGGGYTRSRSLSDIPFSDILALWSKPDHPLAKLFYLWGDCSVKEVMSWPVPEMKGGDVTFHSALDILKMLTTHTPLTSTQLYEMGCISGYTGIFLTKGVKAGFLTRRVRVGYKLVKPYNEMTVGDILPSLSLRGKINAAVLFHSQDILLSHIVSDIPVNDRHNFERIVL